MSKYVTAWFIALCIAFSANAASAQGAAILTQDYYLHYGQNLAAGCKYKLTFQNDGNLVLTDWQRRSIWSSGTAGRGRFVQMQPDGNLVIYDFARNAVWSTRTVNGTIGTKLQLQGDRNLVVYDGHGKALWSSRTVDNSDIGVSI